MLELPRMKKAGTELNKLEEWCYMFRNFPNFVGIPKEVNPRFYKLMDTIRIDNMTDEERTISPLRLMTTNGRISPRLISTTEKKRE